ncbi:SusD family protein [bacterium A37T11]|nr:SusD family protein [bacterium A37T11]
MSTILKQRYLLFLGLSMLLSCRNSGFLDAKYDQSLVVPETLDDLQSLLDNDILINGAGNAGIVPSMGEVAADDYYMTNFGTLPTLMDKNLYTWDADPYAGVANVPDWNSPYRAIFYANLVLDGLDGIAHSAEQLGQYQEIKGTALFTRGHLFYQLLQVFAPPYAPAADMQAPGIVLRLGSDVGEHIQRSSIQACYEQVLADLNAAVDLLPVEQPYKTRPSKAAALALLARVHLTMQNYPEALRCADECLQLPVALLDYNLVDPSKTYPFTRFNQEVIYHSILIRASHLLVSRAIVDSVLYESFADNDLRKILYFKPSSGGRPGHSFNGSYDGTVSLFAGLTTAETYLIRAEAYARTGQLNPALQDINELRRHRVVAGSYIPVTANATTEILDSILTERRKELLFRGTRWPDLRRLNQDQDHAKPLQRIIDDKLYSLPPHSLNYTFPIPDNVIQFSPGMPQNPREDIHITNEQ